MRVLIFGGNGRIAKAMTSLMLARSWDVTSIIRSPSQERGILALGKGRPGLIDVFHYDLRNLKTSSDAVGILQRMNADCIVFAAGSFSSVYEIDRDAAKAVIKAATATDTVSKFLMISFPASRRNPAPWWDEQDVKDYNSERLSYPDIGDAKNQADEYLVAMAKDREYRVGLPFQAISLRPTWLTTESPTGRVHLGETKALGQVAIGDVAAVAVEMLARDDVSGWFDLVQGGDLVEEAVATAVSDGVNCIRGEDVKAMYVLAT
ncbi:NAD(P)-binding protein [Aspergillus californicus]